jgi:hypothetical protein
LVQRLAVVSRAAHRGVQAEAVDICAQVLPELLLPGQYALGGSVHDFAALPGL